MGKRVKRTPTGITLPPTRDHWEGPKKSGVISLISLIIEGSSSMGLIQKSIKNTFLTVLLTNLFVLIIDLVSQLLFLEIKMQHMNLLKQFLRSMNIAKKS